MTEAHGIVQMPVQIPCCSVCGEAFHTSVLHDVQSPEPDEDGLYRDGQGHLRHVCDPGMAHIDDDGRSPNA